ncbi:MAG: DUF2795 domain-containing protein [Ilumatobacteraceae bacterium]
MTDDRIVPEHELLLHLQGVTGPVETSELVDHVRRANAPAEVIATLDRLPDRQWRSVEEATAAIGTGWSMETDGGP